MRTEITRASSTGNNHHHHIVARVHNLNTNKLYLYIIHHHDAHKAVVTLRRILVSSPKDGQVRRAVVPQVPNRNLTHRRGIYALRMARGYAFNMGESVSRHARHFVRRPAKTLLPDERHACMHTWIEGLAHSTEPAGPGSKNTMHAAFSSSIAECDLVSSGGLMTKPQFKVRFPAVSPRNLSPIRRLIGHSSIPRAFHLFQPTIMHSGRSIFTQMICQRLFIRESTHFNALNGVNVLLRFQHVTVLQ
jgi:hypothetical protein